MKLKYNVSIFLVFSTKTRTLALRSILSPVQTLDESQALLALKHHGAIMLRGGMRSGGGGVT
jgi:hypothetical protein